MTCNNPSSLLGHSPGELSGCHNDVASMKNYIMKHHGFKKSDMTILMDDGKHEKPTKARILRAYKEVVEKSRPGDSVFCHYSGHGGRVKDKNGDEGTFSILPRQCCKRIL